MKKKWNYCPKAETMGEVMKLQSAKYKYSSPFLIVQIKFIEYKYFLLLKYSVKTEHNLLHLECRKSLEKNRNPRAPCH